MNNKLIIPIFNEMKHFFYIILITIATMSCNNIDKSQQIKNLTIQADSLAQAMAVTNIGVILKYSNRTYIELKGGKAKFASFLFEGEKAKESHLIFTKSIKAETPSEIITVKDELQAVVPINIETSTPNNTLIEKTFLVAISKDEGRNWLFINTYGRKLSDLKKDYPNLSLDLTLIRK